MKIRFDPTEFTYGDAVALDEEGFNLDEVGKLLAAGKAEVPLRLAVVLIWLIHRKQEPTFTLADAMAMPITETLDFEVVEVDDNPKGDGGAVSSLRSVSGQGGSPKKSKR